MPAVNKPIASVFCGARTAVKVRTVEWMSCGGSEHRTINIGAYPTYPMQDYTFVKVWCIDGKVSWEGKS
jgi:hypothetical protein